MPCDASTDGCGKFCYDRSARPDFPSPGNIAGLDLLIVEDDDALASFGHRATIVPDGRQALDAITNQAFDVILLDRILPVVDGIAVLERQRAKCCLRAISSSARGNSGPGADKPIDLATSDIGLMIFRRTVRTGMLCAHRHADGQDWPIFRGQAPGE